MKTKTPFLKTLLVGLVFTLLGCTEENYYTTADGLGKVNIYIEGNITNEEAQAKLVAEIGTQTENIYVQETTGLTDITINLVGNIRDIYFDKNLDLKNVTINGTNSKANNITIAEYTSNGNDPTDKKYENINISGIIELKNMNLRPRGNQPKIINCNDLVSINEYLFLATNGSVSFNKLKFINRTKKVYGEYSLFSGTYDNFNMPELEEVYNIESLPFVETLTFPKLKKINWLLCEYSIGFQNLNLPLLESCNYMYMRNASFSGSSIVNPTISFPNLNYCETIVLRDLQLETNKVNAILHHFLSVTPATGKNIVLDWNNAAPTGQGLIDKQTLLNQGNNVLTN